MTMPVYSHQDQLHVPYQMPESTIALLPKTSFRAQETAGRDAVRLALLDTNEPNEVSFGVISPDGGELYTTQPTHGIVLERPLDCLGWLATLSTEQPLTNPDELLFFCMLSGFYAVMHDRLRSPRTS